MFRGLLEESRMSKMTKSEVGVKRIKFGES
jgi:hypothetical protein